MDRFFKGLFDKASQNFLEYVYTLLRVGGIESYKKDPLLEFNQKLLANQLTLAEIKSSKDFWATFSNLARIGDGHNYNPHLLFNVNSPDLAEYTKQLVNPDIKEFLEKLFPSDNKELTKSHLDFLKWFFEFYSKILEAAKNAPKYYKAPRFEVLELLTNRGAGLYGFRMHFSNGSHAEYTRDLLKGTTAVNLLLDDSGVGFMVGDLKELKDEWRVGEMRLYEIGLPGKYNKTGEWKPLIYKGNSEHLQEEAVAASSDERVQGTLFYMLVTGHRVIEFAVKAKIDLGEKEVILPSGLHLFRVTKEEELDNESVYDGWLELEDGSVDIVKSGFDSIQRTMSALSFAFNSNLIWTPKYSIYGHERGLALHDEKDLPLLESLLKKIQKYKHPVIDASLDWFQRGQGSGNIFNEFLCYHISIEGLANKLVEAELPMSKKFGFMRKNRIARNRTSKKCIEEYFKLYYKSDPVEFVKHSTDCINSIRLNLEFALKKVFGTNSPIIKKYLSGKNSIWDTRGRIVHGDYSEWNNKQVELVRKNLNELQDISQSFLYRVILGLRPSQKIPERSSKTFRMSVSMYSPRGALVVSDLRMFPIKDWTIKSEWVY